MAFGLVLWRLAAIADQQSFQESLERAGMTAALTRSQELPGWPLPPGEIRSMRTSWLVCGGMWKHPSSWELFAGCTSSSGQSQLKPSGLEIHALVVLEARMSQVNVLPPEIISVLASPGFWRLMAVLMSHGIFRGCLCLHMTIFL